MNLLDFKWNFSLREKCLHRKHLKAQFHQDWDFKDKKQKEIYCNLGNGGRNKTNKLRKFIFLLDLIVFQVIVINFSSRLLLIMTTQESAKKIEM